MPKLVTVRESDIREGAGKRIRHNGRPIAVFKVNGRVFAIDDACPCGGASLSAGAVEDNQVECPLHGYRFDLASGNAVLPPQFEGVTTYPVHVSNGQVEIDVTRPSTPLSAPTLCKSGHCKVGHPCRRKSLLKQVEVEGASPAQPFTSECTKSSHAGDCRAETGSTV